MSNPLFFYKALSEETRLKSLLLMQKLGELCVCDLMEALDLSQPKVSRHLAELRKQELVLDERRGKWVYYQIHPQLALWMKQVLQTTLENNLAFIESELQSILGKSCDNDARHCAQ
ncbi:metalloregulator ArsR/SmtB family transcription factor [Vibrio vulnificus]|jgi:ArsR family transcriptional regulator|uniref:Transcriptional regulator n=1 Tax=Vibrio vulnificus TaxID=672 RepID=A0ABX4X453_VIBVL|nr:metalloregulator ArsR/SmtB family transcription factor [Vibrio vulnificus]AVX01546.1 transcriptional regulator [Vibrio vulnificus Env1]EGQ7933374.1 metalloregulator ArsR/SmtB family transcription factor [Vibrio vulnificus]EGQ7939859.1 metalloregulator ArsR/SmtB family transcription factor [Vibrio vulnificus]EGQ7951509.1 metalloregulator ArsR/SmtB family transcription factor [Vibrio vulnificus]EGQ7980439.1 metalloregulator ArsR/SmtB family transcription factor [Vibrio vulnificus]